jgi:ferrous iron transport protein A
MSRTLADLPRGGRATLGPSPDVSADDGTLLRLLEMGLVPGAAVVLTRRAPFGDPLEIELCGTRLVLRQREAARFLVDDSKDAP